MRTSGVIAATLLVAALALAGCGATGGRGSTGGPSSADSDVATNGRAAPSASATTTAPVPPSGSDTPTPTPTVPTGGARFDDPGEVADVEADARADVVAVDSYDYRRLAQARAGALAATTDSYRAKYLSAFTVIQANAPKQQAVQSAQVNAVGVGPIKADDAAVLVFGQLRLRTRAAPSGRVVPFAATLALHRVGPKWLVDNESVDAPVVGDPPGNAELAAAARATRAGVIALLSYRRADFETDYQRALDSTTGSLRADLAGKKAATKRTLTQGGFDLSATVRSVAASSTSGRAAVFLVRVDGHKISHGSAGAATPQSLKVDVTKVGARWLLRDVQSVGTS